MVLLLPGDEAGSEEGTRLAVDFIQVDLLLIVEATVEVTEGAQGAMLLIEATKVEGVWSRGCLKQQEAATITASPKTLSHLSLLRFCG